MLTILSPLAMRLMCDFRLALIPVMAAILAVVIVASDIRSPLTPRGAASGFQPNYNESFEFQQALTPGVANGATSKAAGKPTAANAGEKTDSDSTVLPAHLGTPIQNAVLNYEPRFSLSVFAVFQS
jgi:hypothetical protein